MQLHENNTRAETSENRALELSVFRLIYRELIPKTGEKPLFCDSARRCAKRRFLDSRGLYMTVFSRQYYADWYKTPEPIRLCPPLPLIF
jgi:hypothetical protein